MNWSEEFWIKLYRRASPSFYAMSIEARGLFRLLLTEVDPSTGELELGKLGLKAVAVAVRAEWAKVKEPVQELLDDGCVAMSEDGATLTIGNFVEAQGAIQSGACRMRKHRARSDKTQPERDVPSQDRDAASPKRDFVRRGVTRGDECDDQIRSDQNRSDQKRSEETRTPAPATPSPRPKSPTTVKRVIPEGWTPTTEHYGIAKDELGRSIAWVDGEARKMVDWAKGKGERKVDWNATFRNWMRKAAEQNQGALIQPPAERRWQPERL